MARGNPRRTARGEHAGYQAAFRDATGASLLSCPAVSQVTERLWQEYEAFVGRDLSEVPVAYVFVDGVAERLHAGPAARGSASGGSSRRGSLEQARRPLPVSDRGCPADGRGAQGDANPSTADRTVIETAGARPRRSGGEHPCASAPSGAPALRPLTEAGEGPRDHGTPSVAGPSDIARRLWPWSCR